MCYIVLGRILPCYNILRCNAWNVSVTKWGGGSGALSLEFARPKRKGISLAEPSVPDYGLPAD